MAGTNYSAQQLQIEAMQSVSPSKVTEPPATRRVLVTDPNELGILKGCLSVVLYYQKVTEKGLGLIVAGWIRDSLGRALMEQPLLGGRLRRVQEDGNRELEIVPNDSGARLVEAKIAVTLLEFLDLNGKSKLESELVFWEDVDEQNLRFYPLLYVQVTNFRCGGYSIGITCSLLVADLLIMDDFLRKWAKIHSDMMSGTDSVIQTPIFYHPNHKPSTFSPDGISSTASKLITSQAMIFKMVDENIRRWEHESCKKLASLCIKETRSRLGGLMPSRFSLVIMKQSENSTEVEVCKKDEDFMIKSPLNLKTGVVRISSWDDIGMKEVAFQKGNKPVHTSCWIGSVLGGVMIAIPFIEQDDDNTPGGMSIIVTVPE